MTDHTDGVVNITAFAQIFKKKHCTKSLPFSLCENFFDNTFSLDLGLTFLVL